MKFESLKKVAFNYFNKLSQNAYDSYAQVINIALRAAELNGKSSQVAKEVEDIYAEPEEETRRLAQLKQQMSRIDQAASKFLQDAQMYGLTPEGAGKYKNYLLRLVGQLSTQLGKASHFTEPLRGALMEFVPARVVMPAKYRKTVPYEEEDAGYPQKEEEDVKLPPKAYETIQQLVEQNYPEGNLPSQEISWKR